MTTTSSREAILARIKSGRPAAVPHPAVKARPVKGDPIENFNRKLTSFDGRMERFATRADALAWLAERVDPAKSVVFSAIDDFDGSISLADLADPHAANVVDVCIASGLLGVGETGSVWVTDRSLGLPAAALFSTDLYLLLDASAIVDGIHDAYSRIDLGDSPYGSFYTGPSATADIEAVHITGAQGEISLTVLLYNYSPKS